MNETVSNLCEYTKDVPTVVMATLYDARIYYAAPLGYVTIHNPEIGSRYISKLCSVLCLYAKDAELDEIIKRTGELYVNGTEGVALYRSVHEDFGFNLFQTAIMYQN